MELVAFMRILWTHRRAVGLGFVAACAIGVGVGGSPSSSSGLAWSRLVLDTPRSQLIDSAPEGAETLPWRAALLAHLVASEPVKRQIAQQLGVRSDELLVVDPSLKVPEVSASLPKAAAEAAAISPRPYVLSVDVSNEVLPLISIEAAAPDRGRAVRLAEAAGGALRSEASPGGRRRLQPFVVEEAAPVRARTLTEGGAPVTAVAAAVMVFGLWCACVVVLPLLPQRARVLRRTQPT